jgi:hypothetical protein
MTVGFVILAHKALDRVAAVAGHLADGGCPVVVHVDAAVPKEKVALFRAWLDEAGVGARVLPSDRRRCEWGRFSIVAATQAAARLMLDRHPEVGHVFLASGACLPVRPLAELRSYLAARPDTDFIESVMTDEAEWAVGGLDHERFTLHFPFSWRRRRRLFDLHVALQRRIGVCRAIPPGIEPHLGSQWWCLTRRTLAAILDDPERPAIDRYFRHVWIPDESYFQTLARRHARRIESRSLTLTRFDPQGRPHVFYDDHLELLGQTDRFMARKVWPGARRLYATFLGAAAEVPRTAPAPARIDRHFAAADRRRREGRAGLVMQSRFPRAWSGAAPTAAPYAVFHGFDAAFEGFHPWLASNAATTAHGHLFHLAGAEFAGADEGPGPGCLPRAPKLRDYAPAQFLANLVRITAPAHQSFLFGPGDAQGIVPFLASDPNARIAVISGGWALALHRSGLPFARQRKIAARQQRIEAQFLAALRDPAARARVRIWTLSDFMDRPVPHLQEALGLALPAPRALTGAPVVAPLDGFAGFLQTLRNQGMRPHLVGEFPAGDRPPGPQPPAAGRPRLDVVR